MRNTLHTSPTRTRLKTLETEILEFPNTSNAENDAARRTQGTSGVAPRQPGVTAATTCARERARDSQTNQTKSLSRERRRRRRRRRILRLFSLAALWRPRRRRRNTHTRSRNGPLFRATPPRAAAHGAAAAIGGAGDATGSTSILRISTFFTLSGIWSSLPLCGP